MITKVSCYASKNFASTQCVCRKFHFFSLLSMERAWLKNYAEENKVAVSTLDNDSKRVLQDFHERIPPRCCELSDADRITLEVQEYYLVAGNCAKS